MRIFKTALAVILFLAASTGAFAQATHYSDLDIDCTERAGESGERITVYFNNLPLIGINEVEVGDEVAIYRNDGGTHVLFGAGIVMETPGGTKYLMTPGWGTFENLGSYIGAVYAYGEEWTCLMGNCFGCGQEVGFTDNETMYYKIWDNSASMEYIVPIDDASYFQMGTGWTNNYTSDFGFMVVDYADAPMFVTPTLQTPADEAANVTFDSGIDFQWSAVDATSYQFQLSTSDEVDGNGAFTSALYTANPTTISLNVPAGTFNHKTTYYWIVRAYDGSEYTDWSDPFEYTTIIAPPDAVTGMTPADGAFDVATYVDLEWNASEAPDVDPGEETSYTVKVGETSDLTGADVYDVGQNLMKALGNLKYGKTYYWSVTPSNIGGDGPESAVYSLTTKELPMPEITSPDYAQGNGDNVPLGVNFAWDWDDPDLPLGSPVFDDIRYEVWVTDSEGSELFSYDGLTESPKQCDVGAGYLDYSSAYSWHVVAYIDQGDGWEVQSGYDAADFITGPISAPTLVNPINNGELNITNGQFSWNAVPLATGYTLYIERDEDGVQEEVSVSGTTKDVQAAWFEGAGLEADKYYTWWVVAHSGDNTSANSAMWSFMANDFNDIIIDYTGAGTSENDTYTVSVCSGETSVKLYPDGVRWVWEGSSPDDPSAYTYSISPNQGINGHNTSTPELNYAQTGRRYTMRVYDPVADEYYYGYIDLTVNPQPFLRLQRRALFVDDGVSDFDLYSTVSSHSSGTGWEIDWSDNSNFTSILGTSSAGATAVEVSPPSRVNRYYAELVIGGCESRRQQTMVISRPAKQAAAIAGLNGNVEIYPNPTVDNVNINAYFGEAQDVEMKLVDMLGRQVSNSGSVNAKFVESSIDMSELPAGVYFLHIRVGSETTVEKIIKQ